MSSEIGLRFLRIGHCLGPKALTERGGAWALGRFPAMAALIQHPLHGTILFDTGYGAAFFAATRGLPERFYRWFTPVRLPKGEALPQQLAALGVATPDLVVLSHLHGDHVAGLFDLGPLDMPLLTSREAIEGLGLGRLASLRAGCPKGLRDRLRALPLQSIEDRAEVDLTPFHMGAFGKGRDLLGDGSLIAIALPGHGCGQFGLLLPQSALGPVFLIADAAWSGRALRENRPPPATVLRRLGDLAAYERSFAALRALGQSWPELRLIASHCPETFEDSFAAPFTETKTFKETDR